MDKEMINTSISPEELLCIPDIHSSSSGIPDLPSRYYTHYFFIPPSSSSSSSAPPDNQLNHQIIRSSAKRKRTALPENHLEKRETKTNIPEKKQKIETKAQEDISTSNQKPKNTTEKKKLRGEEESDSNYLCHHQYIYQHSNRICVLGLAPSHPVVLGGCGKIVKIDFKPGRVDFAKLKISGKTKKGGSWVQPQSKVCLIHCENGQIWKVVPAIRGRIIEINERLMKEPDLLRQQPGTEGFIAIILPKYSENSTVCSHLLTKEEYEAKMKKSQDQ